MKITKTVSSDAKIRNPLATVRQTGSGRHKPAKGKGSYNRKQEKRIDNS